MHYITKVHGSELWDVANLNNKLTCHLHQTIESHLFDYFRITTIPRGLRQWMFCRASARGDEVPSPNAERCALPSEARLAHSESGGGGTKSP